MNIKTLVTAGTTAAAMSLSPMVMADNILVVMSDKAALALQNDQVYNTGFYLNELMQPVKRFIDNGHQVTFATPSGLAPSLDVNSDTVGYFGNDKEAHQIHKKLMQKLKITDAANSPVIS